MSIKLRLFNKRTVLATILVVVTAGLVCLVTVRPWGHYSDRLDFSISIANPIITKDKFITINATLVNMTHKLQWVEWANCAQNIRFYMDGRLIYKSYDGCDIGPGSIGPGQMLSQTLAIDPTNYTNGPHSFYVVYQGMRSNTLGLVLKSPAVKVDCYDFTKYATPLCSQISIDSAISTTSASFNLSMCKTYFNYLSSSTPLKPIPSLSSLSCARTGTLTPYAVVNVPKGDPGHWANKLSNHFSYNNMPNEDASVWILQYPNSGLDLMIDLQT